MRNLIQITTAVGVATATAAVLAACGGGSGGGSTPAAASTPTTAASGGGAQAYFACLQQHGVNIPTSRPTARPSGGFGGGGGGGGGGFFGPGASANPTMAAAQQACASVRPTAGFGGGFGGRGGTQLVAFRNCMSQQGVAIPTARPTAPPTAQPTARPTGAARYLGGLDPNDPKVSAALKICTPLLPSPGARPSSSPAG